MYFLVVIMDEAAIVMGESVARNGKSHQSMAEISGKIFGFTCITNYQINIFPGPSTILLMASTSSTSI